MQHNFEITKWNQLMKWQILLSSIDWLMIDWLIDFFCLFYMALYVTFHASFQPWEVPCRQNDTHVIMTFASTMVWLYDCTGSSWKELPFQWVCPHYAHYFMPQYYKSELPFCYCKLSLCRCSHQAFPILYKLQYYLILFSTDSISLYLVLTITSSLIEQ